MKTGLPKSDLYKRVRTRVAETKKSVQKFLTATELRINTAAFIAGSLIGLIIFNATPSTAQIMLKNIAQLNTSPSYQLGKAMIEAFLLEALFITAVPVILFHIYSKRDRVWKFLVAAYHLSLIALALPSIFYLHIAINDIIILPVAGVVEGIPEWPALTYFAVLGMDKIYREVKDRYD